MITVHVSYPVTGRTRNIQVDEYLEMLAKKYSGEIDTRFSDVDIRGMTFDFPSFGLAKSFADEAKTVRDIRVEKSEEK